jgi:predicted anti-sigma-YlaC factor YlaD
MTCTQVQELLAAFADGGLEGREHDLVAAHVRGCTACADEVRVLRELLGDTRRLAAPAPPRQGDEAFWHDMARDIRAAVAQDSARRPRSFWWRVPALGVAFAMAAAAVLWVYVHGPSTVGRTTPARTVAQALRPLPPSADIDDLDADQLADLNAALSGEDVAPPTPDEDELAVANAAAAENLIDSLDDTDLTRVATAL